MPLEVNGLWSQFRQDSMHFTKLALQDGPKV